MEALIALLIIYLVVILLVFPVWMIIRTRRQDGEQEVLRLRLDYLDGELRNLQARRHDGAATAPAAPARPVQPAPGPVTVPPRVVPPPVGPAPIPPTRPEFLAAMAEPPVIAPGGASPACVPSPEKPAINWEQFMGAKLFAWLGGLALLLGVAFFVKYSFDHGWVSPELRVALGYALGTGLIGGGVRLTARGYATPAQTLVGAGTVSLYIVTFAANSIYQFPFFGPVPTFLLMMLITAAAFLLAVRLDAQVVALLGILGGFLTPVLINTGADNPPGLFGYLALLDAGLIAVALATGWRYLVPLSAAGTVLLLLGWTDEFFLAEKGPVAMTVCLGFGVLYQAAGELARRRRRNHLVFAWTAAALPLVGFAFALFFLNFPGLAARAPLYLGYVLLLDGLLLAQAWRDETLPRLHLAAGLITFTVLLLWTAGDLTDDLLPWSLTACLLFAALHTAFPLLLERRRPVARPAWWSQLFAPLTLLLLLLPILRLDPLPFFIWPAILLVDLIAIGLAVLSAALLPVAAVLVLTLLATALCLLKGPVTAAAGPPLLLVIGGFAVFFFAASLWLVRRIGDRLPAADGSARVFGDARTQIPAFSALLPFLLLIMVCARLPVPDPSAVFGLGLLLVGLTLGLTAIFTRQSGNPPRTSAPGSTGPAPGDGRPAGVEWLPACALAGMAALEFAWHSRHFHAPDAAVPLAWYAGFYAAFAGYPFLFRRDFAKFTGPWAVAALSGVAHYWMISRAVAAAWPNDYPGLVPAVLAVAPLTSLALVRAREPADNPKRLNQLAWFGGVALFFITLVFPVQFERQWLTVAWALEGMALLWLFHRVPHPGLRAVGVVLLGAAFARLALNPAVLGYHVRGDTALLNWYLYAYGLVTAALFAGARLLAPPRGQVLGCSAPPLLNTLAVILAFLLLNLEIADYFTRPGAHTLTFQFRGNFGRDMTYTIAWALFALGLLGAGIWKKQRAARYAALALLGVTLLKLFLHDLARLEALYRIGALFAVAVIAILASFAYQRFQPGDERIPPPLP